MSLGTAILAELDDSDLNSLAARLAPRMPGHQPQREDPDRWLNTREAADYLGLPVSTLHKLTAARQVPFEQDCVGGKCWFLRSDLEAWRRGQ